MDEKILKMIGGVSSYYPHELERQFPRVLEKITQLWGTEELEVYINELMMDSRDGQRKGFPHTVASELMYLGLLYSKNQKETSKEIWSSVSEKYMQEMEALGFKHTPQGFMQASEAGNLRAIQIFIGSGIDLETRDERDWTPLMISAFNGKETAAYLLIQSGAKIDAQDHNGYSPIHWAAFNGYSEVVSILIRNGANPNALSNFGWTPLIQAATRGHIVVAAQLIAGGAHVNAISKDNWSALHKAAANGHADLVRLLLSKGANTAIEYQEGGTALTLAIKGKYEEIISMLEPRI